MGLIFREFRQALERGEPGIRIVVPTATLVRHLQHEIARDGLVFPPKSVVSLSRFIAERAADARQAPAGLLRIAVRNALRRSELPDSEGMAPVVTDTIELFENAGCTPERLAQVRRLPAQGKAFAKLWSTIDSAIRERGFVSRAELIRAAAKNVQPARIWMTGFLNFSPIEEELIRALAKTCDLTLTIDDGFAAQEMRRFVCLLGGQDRLIQEPARPAPEATIVAAPSVEREADEISRRIIELHSKGIPFRRMAIALRDVAAYVPLLRATLERFGIPARFYFSTALKTHPVAVFLGGLIAGALNNWPFESTIEALRNHPGWGTKPDFDRFDFAAREVMPGHGAEAMLALCKGEALRADLERCFKIASWRDARLRAADWRLRFEQLAEALYRPEKVEPGRNFADVEAIRGQVAALRSWFGAIESAEAFWPADSEIPLDEFWSAASAAIESAVIHGRDDRSDVVHVMSVYEARQWDVSALFLCGLTDSQFPRRPAPNSFFSGTDFEALISAGIALRRADDEREDQTLFDTLLARATDCLCLSYPEHDNAGRSVLPSRFLSGSGASRVKARYCRPELSALWTAPGTANQIRSERLVSLLRQLHHTISTTGLEELAQCRFKFFAGRTLDLKGAPDLPHKRLTPKITGSILHQALDQWQSQQDRDFVELFEQAFDEVCLRNNVPPGFKQEVERFYNRLIAREVSASDKWLKPDSSLTEVAFELPLVEGIKVTGRIDRVDRFGSDAVIVDYKSKKKENVQKLTRNRAKLQGPIYALAVRETMNLNPVAMVYWAVRDDQLFGWGQIPGYQGELIEMGSDWIDRARTLAVGRLWEFLSGSVTARPEEVEDCGYCDFRDACGYKQGEALVMIEGAA